jgi:hypothetical protein
VPTTWLTPLIAVVVATNAVVATVPVGIGPIGWHELQHTFFVRKLVFVTLSSPQPDYTISYSEMTLTNKGTNATVNFTMLQPSFGRGP